MSTKSVPLRNPSQTTGWDGPFPPLLEIRLSPSLGAVYPTPVALELAILLIATSYVISPAVAVDNILIPQSAIASVPLTDVSKVQ